CRHGGAERGQVDDPECMGARRGGVRYPDEVDEGIGRFDLWKECPSLEWIPRDRDAPGGQLRFGAGAHKRANLVGAIEEPGDEMPADKSRSAGDEHRTADHSRKALGIGLPVRSVSHAIDTTQKRCVSLTTWMLLMPRWKGTGSFIVWRDS